MVGQRFRVKVNAVWFLWLVVILLLVWAFQRVPIAEIGNALSSLKPWQAALLISLNAIILVITAARWWVILRASGYRLPFTRLLSYRLSGFAVSYFTPGPQFGGEPIQAALLTRNHSVSTAAAAGAVILDKVIEILINTAVLSTGIAFLMVYGSGARFQPDLGILVPGILALTPFVHLLALKNGKQPVSAIFRSLSFNRADRLWKQKLFSAVQSTEQVMADFLRVHPGSLILVVGLSLLAWVFMAVEYGLLLSLVSRVSDWHAVAVGLVAARLAFLAPTPAGLGALEASQVLAMETIGLTAAAGISLSLVMRGRDIFIGLLGLALGGLSLRRAAAAPQNKGVGL